MKTTREFAPADRYIYDFGLCSYENGWAQVDTAQDAAYFGTWANPARVLIFRHVSGTRKLARAISWSSNRNMPAFGGTSSAKSFMVS